MPAQALTLLKMAAAVLALLAVVALVWLALPVVLCLASFPYVCALLLQGAQIIAPWPMPEQFPFSSL